MIRQGQARSASPLVQIQKAWSGLKGRNSRAQYYAFQGERLFRLLPGATLRACPCLSYSATPSALRVLISNLRCGFNFQSHLLVSLPKSAASSCSDLARLIPSCEVEQERGIMVRVVDFPTSLRNVTHRYPRDVTISNRNQVAYALR